MKTSVKMLKDIMEWESDNTTKQCLADDLLEAHVLIERMKDLMMLEMWKRGGIVNFPPSYRFAIADAVKFLKDEENK